MSVEIQLTQAQVNAIPALGIREGETRIIRKDDVTKAAFVSGLAIQGPHTSVYVVAANGKSLQIA